MAEGTSDRRRARWLAVDVHYYDGPLGVALRDQLGVVGLVVFDAFLRACKRNPTPGQLTYGSEAGFLDQIGLPCLTLANEDGQDWTLEDLWRVTAHHKVTARTTRARLVQVRCTHWTDWQQDGNRAAAADGKRRSRDTNTATMPGQSEDNAAPDIDSDKDKEIDIDLASRDGSESTADDDELWNLYADRKQSAANLSTNPNEHVRNPATWRARVIEQARADLAPRLASLREDYRLTNAQLADVLLLATNPAWLKFHRKSADTEHVTSDPEANVAGIQAARALIVKPLKVVGGRSLNGAS